MEECVQYYVEGEDEKKLLQVLKTDMGLIRPGKIQVFNVANKIMTRTRLISLSKETIVVVVFDTDKVNVNILKKNIELMNQMANIKEVLTVMQVGNLEAELVRSCKIKSAEELLGARNRGEFKSKFLKTTNLATVLKRKGFDITKMWIKNDPKLPDFKNMGKRLSLKE